MTKVMTPTSITNSKIGLFNCAKKSPVRVLNRRTRAILIKLLATKMVANKRFGRFSRRLIFLSTGVLSISVSSKLLMFREKKATSAPEISAEANSKSNTNPNWINVIIAKGGIVKAK